MVAKIDKIKFILDSMIRVDGTDPEVGLWDLETENMLEILQKKLSSYIIKVDGIFFEIRFNIEGKMEVVKVLPEFEGVKSMIKMEEK